MASSSDEDDVFDQFLTDAGHSQSSKGWDESYNKKQCPDCGGIEDESSEECSSCGWTPSI